MIVYILTVGNDGYMPSTQAFSTLDKAKKAAEDAACAPLKWWVNENEDIVADRDEWWYRITPSALD